LKCNYKVFLEKLDEIGVSYEWVKPEQPKIGERWWPYPYDAWPLMNLAILKQIVEREEILVVKPGDPQQVSKIVKTSAQMKMCIIPRGGGSGVLGSTTPRDCCIILDLTRLDWIEPYLQDGYIYAGSGAFLYRVEEWLETHGYTTGLEPQSIKVATVGGLVNTLGAGALQPGIGNIEDSVLFIDFVDGNGRIIRLGDPHRPRPHTIGGGLYTLLGGEGTLGITIGVGLRVRKLPKYTSSATYSFQSLEEALRTARALIQWNQPALLRILDEYESQLYGISGNTLLVAYYDDEDERVPQALMNKADQIVRLNGGSRIEDIYDKWRKNRYEYHQLLEKIDPLNLWFDTIDLQASWSILPKLHQVVMEELNKIEGVIGAFSHISHFNLSGGSLYLTILVERDPQVLAKAWINVLAKTSEMGGSITHHHGVGLQKLYWYILERREELRIYCKVKEELDPYNIFNPHGIASLCNKGDSQWISMNS